MAPFTLSPLNATFGVDVVGLDLNEVSAERHFPQIRALFEEHSALLFRGQDLGPEKHLEIARLFGPIEDREADEREAGKDFAIPEVSNIQQDGTLSAEMDLKTLNLKANFLWHTDSTFLPVPALINMLVARIVAREGGATELASTRAAWAEMPAELKQRIAGRGIWHRYAESRRKISETLARLPLFTKWPDTHWGPVWTNPVNGREALYIASHAYRVDGYDEEQSAALLEALTDFVTQERYVYTHRWQEGDVLLWDQRAVMHRGRPWPFDQPRKLSSLCVSAQESDGRPVLPPEPQHA